MISSDLSSISHLSCLCRNFWVLVGTASTWFLLDIAFYSQNLFLPNILEGIGYNPKINLPASKCVKTKTCPHYNLPVSPTPSTCPITPKTVVLSPSNRRIGSKVEA